MNRNLLLRWGSHKLSAVSAAFFRLGPILFILSINTAYAQNITRPNFEGPAGLQVNSFTGSLFYQRNDLLIKGRGLSLDITFSYNSADRSKDRGFGYGWTFTYNQFYEFDTTGIIIYKADGKKDHFNSSGSAFQSPKGVFDILTQYESGKYRLHTKDGTEYYFENPASRKLTRIKDRNGNEITLFYTGDNLTGIKDASARTVSLKWEDNRLASMVTQLSSATRTIKYTYDKGSGNLLSVTNALGNSISYTYGPSRLMSTCKDANGNVANITYNSKNAVIKLLSCEREQNISYDSTNGKTFIVEANGTQALVTSYQFDEEGRLIDKSGNCCGFKNIYSYDDDNNISSITDANGNLTVYGYDKKGNLLTETDALQQTNTYTYDTTYSEITVIIDKKGNKTTFNYDPKGNLLQVNRPLNIVTKYTYDIYGNRTGITDPKQNKTLFDYNQHGYITSVTYPGAGNTSFTYDDWGNLLTQKDQNNNITTLSYDALNQLTSVVDALGGETSISYDANGNQTSIKDANANVTKFDYDPLNKPVTVTDAAGNISGNTYDAAGNIISKTDPNGRTTKYSYDNLNRLVTEINAAGDRTAYSYDGNGNRVTVSLPNGNTINYIYDNLNRIVSVIDNLGTIVSYTYDPNSNKLSETDAKGNTTTYKYDVLNRLVAITDPAGNSYAYSYDANSNRIKETDRNGNSSSSNYDVLNRRINFTDANANITTYNWDKVGNVLSVKDANGNITLYKHDALNRNTEEQFADNTKKIFSYDAVGNLVTRKDNKGQTVEYKYDKLYRPVIRIYPSSVDSFAYDAVGHLIKARNTESLVLFSYDAAYRIASEMLNDKVTSYVYDIAAGKKTITYPIGRIIQRQSDVRNQLKNIQDGNGAILAAFNYNAAGEITSKIFGNNTIGNITYNSNGGVTNINYNPSGFYNVNYTNDKEVNPLSAQFVHKSSNSEQYGYDKVNQLIKFTKGAAQSTYNYDGVGNRTTAQLSGTTTTYTANNMNAYTKVMSGNTVNYSYDENGNLTTDGSKTFTYDEENRLTSVSGNVNAVYTYDALGRRIKKTVGNSITNYYYNVLQVIEERDKLDSVTATYAWGTWLDDIVSMKRDNQSYYYHTNTLGSVIAITDSLGNVKERYEYDAFGNVSMYDGFYNSVIKSSIRNTYAYTGREFDIELGNLFYRVRSYDSKNGRFIQRDPIGFGGGSINLYSYVLNNPTSFIDPLGLWVVSFGVNFERSYALSGGGGYGIAFGSSEKGGIEFGTFTKTSVGYSNSPGFSTKITGGFAEGNIENFGGESKEVGFGGYILPGTKIGGGVSFGKDQSNNKSIEFSASLGLGPVPVEFSFTKSNTTINLNQPYVPPNLPNPSSYNNYQPSWVIDPNAGKPQIKSCPHK